MAKFAYNKAKNANTEYTYFKLNCKYHPRIFYKENIDLYFRFKVTDELIIKLRNLIFRKSITCLITAKTSPK